MIPIVYGLTPQGFNTPRLANVKQFVENDFVATYGNVNLDPQSVAGQIIGIFSKMYADQWENLEDVYFSQYPNSALGTSLDNVVALNGITRLPATQTSVVATCDGLEGTLIPANALANIPSTGDQFYAVTGGIISRSNADSVIIKIVALATQIYTVVLNNTAFSYSLPVITFTGSFIAGNVAVVTVNGVALTGVPFNTNSNQTVADIATEIATAPSVLSAVAVGSVITITPNVGYNVVINSITNSGTGAFPTYAVTFLAPGSNNALTAALTAIINANSPPWTCIDNMDGTITINANVPSIPFSCSIGVNLSITHLSSPITFFCDQFGPIPCPAGALTNIITPIAGWNSITNLIAGNTGTLVETDAQLRIRRQNSIKLLGSATVPAITAGLLQKVPGVTSAIVFENTSLTETNIVATFPQPFTSGDVITNTVEGISPFAVNFTTDQATTMGLLVTAYEALEQVSSASYGGSGNQTLTIVFKSNQEFYLNSITTNVSAQSATINGGRPPKSFEAVVEGGTDEAVANQIWQTKPAGIQTFGNVNSGNGITITDSQGNTQIIYFSRPSPIYIWIQVALTLDTQETFPANGTQLVQQAIFNYGESLGVGINVLLQRVQAQIFQVPGVASGVMTMAFTLSPTTSPASYSTSDITIADNQISLWDLSRITVTVV
jgi:uncharacterized phage protein gp47/JayE